MNPIIWDDYGKKTLKCAREYPSKYVMLYPNFSYRTNLLVHRFYEIFYHFVPAILYDYYLQYQGFKPILFNIAKRYKAAVDTGIYLLSSNIIRLSQACHNNNNHLFKGTFFAMHEWHFDTTNVKELIKEVNAADDGELFNIDIRTMNWDDYLKNYMLGIRKFILKDDLRTLSDARKKVKK